MGTNHRTDGDRPSVASSTPTSAASITGSATRQKFLTLHRAAQATGLPPTELERQSRWGERASMTLYQVEVPVEATRDPLVRYVDRMDRILKIAEQQIPGLPSTYKDAGLNAVHVAILMAMSHHLDNMLGVTYVSIGRLARELSTSRRTVERALELLRQLELVVIAARAPRHPQSRLSNVYKFGPSLMPITIERLGPPDAATSPQHPRQPVDWTDPSIWSA